MTTLEIILITYICISQILAMVIVIFSPKTYKKIETISFFILNPFGAITAIIIFYLRDRKEKANEI